MYKFIIQTSKRRPCLNTVREQHQNLRNVNKTRDKIWEHTMLWIMYKDVNSRNISERLKGRNTLKDLHCFFESGAVGNEAFYF